ncbi:Glycoside hydrolase family 3 protein [Mycena sanguinolenta]|uniref:beta-glucosidase n=1 Tax=Mycena sanguinolenta TaxID=230812 RepID=A0A8H6XJ94_9AGAR|nr:Glycoside hydrolase family 3 protein [Mycena sanguinolenta]
MWQMQGTFSNARIVSFALLASFALTSADVTTGIPDAAPVGFETWTSPVVLPAPPVIGTGDWESAIAKATEFVSGLTLEEKVNITTGRDMLGPCLGNTGEIPRVGWKGLCLQDSPLGVRLADFVTMGKEHRGKGVNVALGPMTNLARQPAAGRNWEGFGADPFLAGAATAATIEGYQSVGVIATVKHYIANEQEHYRGGSSAAQIASSNIDDRTMHELYLWPFAEAVKAGVGSVMAAYNKINQTQACQNSKLINGLLKQELGFQGALDLSALRFIMSDWAAMVNGVEPALAGLDMNMPGFVGYGVGPQSAPDPSKATNSYWGAALVEMVRNGSVPMARLDDMVIRTLGAWFKMGQDRDYPAVNIRNTKFVSLSLCRVEYASFSIPLSSFFVQADHFKLIREMGAASTILLKNVDGALPLQVRNIKRVGIFGSDAGPSPDGPNGCTDRGCNEGTLAMGWGSGTADFPYLVDPLSAITAHVQSIDPTVAIESVLSDSDLKRTSATAARADTCLVFVSADSGEGYITVENNAGDRNDLNLWHGGDALVAATAAVCADTVVVLHVVGPVLMENWIDHPNVTAVLHAGLPGQESGNALVDVLFADGAQAMNPSGRLPTMQTPQITYEEGLHIDYRYFLLRLLLKPRRDVLSRGFLSQVVRPQGNHPRFEFGFGLSYTKFAYSEFTISASDSAAVETITTSAIATVSASDFVTRTAASSSPTQTVGEPATLYEGIISVSFRIQNTGTLAGNEVPQLYLNFPPTYGEPPKVLRGFSRVRLERGEGKSVTISLRRKDVSVWDVVSQQWIIAKGTFRVMVGSSSRNIHLEGTFHL